MNKVFKYRIYGNTLTIQNATNWLDLCRQLYNLALEQKINAYKQHKKTISKFQQMREVTELRSAFPEYKNINANVLHNIIKRLDRAYEGFFRRIEKGEKAGFPRFQGYDRYNSFTFRHQDGYKINGKYLDITWLGRFKIKLSRPIEGTIKEVTIKRSLSNKWFVSFICADIPNNPLPKVNKVIGIDVGCESFLTDSNGNKVDNPHFFKKSQDILAKRQQKLSHKKIGSNRRKKAKILIANTHEKIFNQRKDFHYKVANRLLKENDTIYIEKLKSWTSWRNLNRSMRDVAWFQFFNILKVKAEYAGRKVIEVPAKNTSQICSNCGTIVQKDLACRIHSCSCGLTIDRDFNSAINILNIGSGRAIGVASP